ncbi:MAG TPA: glycosyltransferase, partial [Gemmatimonadaceae bacterium]|nr:glycosyltransferase [Gemmatimonadaceae bacterium]
RRQPAPSGAGGVVITTRQPDGARRGLLGRAIAEARRHLRVWDVTPDPYRSWMRAAIRAGRALGRRTRADVVIASGPPWTGVLVGHRIARTIGVPFIADFRDPWSSGSGATWRAETDWAQRRVERWEATVLGESAVVCFNSPRVASTATSITPLGDRVRVILNGSDVSRQNAPTVVPNAAPLRFRHIGSLYHGRSVVSLIRALEELIAAGKLQPEEVLVELIGHKEPAAGRAGIGETRVPVEFIPHLRFSEVSKRMAEPGVLVAVQTELFANQIPTKLFDYLCTGNPIFVLGPRSSADWDLASQFGRCHHLDLNVTDHNRATVERIIDQWRRGELLQEASAEDTRHLAKQPIGAEFVRLVEDVVAGSHRATGGSRGGEERPAGSYDAARARETGALGDVRREVSART